MKVVDISEENGNSMRTPEQMLEEALGIIRDPENTSSFKNAKKMLIISLDTSNDMYFVNWMNAGMNMSQCVSLCEVAKMQFIGEMEHIVTPENIEKMLEP